MNAAFESALSFVLTGLWRATWQATLLAGVVLILQRVLGKRLGGRGRFALWAIVVLRLLLPVLPESRFSIFNLSRAHPNPIAQTVAQTPSETTEIPIIVIGAGAVKPPPVQQSNLPAASAVSKSAPKRINWIAWIFAAWIAGVLTLWLHVAHICLELSRTIRRLSVVSDLALLGVVESCAKTLRLRRIPRVLAGETVQTPAVVGLFRPKLLLPSDVLSHCDDREIRLIVLHELAHLKRHDIASNWLIALASVLHWFNPIVWLLGARMRADREVACDELVLAHSSGEAHVYGRDLVKLIEILSPSTRSIAVSPRQLAIVGILESTTPMQRRVRMIAQFDPKQSRTQFRRWIWTVVVFGLLAACALTDAVHAEKKLPAASSTQPSTRPVSEIHFVIDSIDGSQNDSQLQAALAKVLPEVKFENVPLGDTMEFIRQASDVNLVVKWHALEAAGIDRNAQVSVNLKNITVAQAMDHILADAGGGTVQMGYAIDDGAIVVSTQDDVSQHTKTVAYDVQNLIVPENGESRENAVTHLLKVIQDLAAQDTWTDNGGNTGTIREFNGKLIVQNTPAAHEKVAALLKLLESEKPAQAGGGTLQLMPGGGIAGAAIPMVMPPQQPPMAIPHTVVSDEEIEAANKEAIIALKKKIPDVKFDNIPFSDAVDFFRDTTGANIFVNWKAVEEAGIDRNTPITLRLKDSSFDTMLTATIRQVNAQMLALVVDRGVITVTTVADLPGYMLTKTYDVKQLAESNEDMQSLCSVVQTLTTTQEGGGTVQFFGKKLVITATPGTHEQIQKLLTELSAGKPTTRATQ